ncbi:hypothetical protein L596_023954 [Steinernema carpocapsae]|uniref:Uncharacterized protein n=1 Tax=Steinernema carpocapsae TaxID=34508 RepID=A0A4U5MFG1_STECR|nr:hypothetical protein L596_023954 [Steinernema carpocapsae]
MASQPTGNTASSSFHSIKDRLICAVCKKLLVDAVVLDECRHICELSRLPPWPPRAERSMRRLPDPSGSQQDLCLQIRPSSPGTRVQTQPRPLLPRGAEQEGLLHPKTPPGIREEDRYGS